MPSKPARALRSSTPRVLALLLALPALTLACGDDAPVPETEPPRPADAPPPGPRPTGMLWVPPGTFVIGSDDPFAAADERGRLEVRLSGFWMDATEVTNARFTEFTRTTGYVTRAERAHAAGDLAARPSAVDADARATAPGAFVFVPSPGDESPADAGPWRWTPGADWRHPAGPDDTLDGRGSHPVVQIAYEDAVAFAAWAGKRLPTEAEWEYAARGGHTEHVFAWGDDVTCEGRWMGNVHQGPYPLRDEGADGFVGSAPVGRFEPGGYGLLDMAGNAREWISDFYRADRRWAGPGPVRDPTGPESSLDPDAPRSVRRVTKGGSFLSSASGSHVEFRPSARRSSDPDTAYADTGFRCVMSQAMWEAWRER